MRSSVTRSLPAVSESSPTPRRVVGLVSVLLVCAAAYYSADSADIQEALPLLLVAAALQTVPLFAEKRIDPFSPATLTGFITLLGLIGIILSLVLTNKIDFGILPPLGTAARVELLDQVSLGYILGTTSYFAGYYYVTRSQLPSPADPEGKGRDWSVGRLRIITIVCAAIFIGAYAYFQARVGTNIDVLDMGAGKAVWRDDPTLSWLHRGVGLGMVPPLFYAALVLRRPRLVSFVVLGVVCLALSFLVMRIGQRGWSVYFLLNILVLAHYLWRPIPLWLLLGGTLAVVGGSNILGTARRGADTSEVVLSAKRFQAVEVLAAYETDRQRLGAAAVIMYYFPDRRDFLGGKTWLGLIVAPIPRWLFADKADYGQWADTQIVLRLAGAPIPSSYQFTLYANFGWLGVALGMFGLGAFHRGLGTWRERNKADRGATLLYSTVLLYFGPTMLQIGASFQTVIPVAVGIWFIVKRGQTVRVVAARAQTAS